MRSHRSKQAKSLRLNNPQATVVGAGKPALAPEARFVTPAVDEIACLCWCERKLVWVPQNIVVRSTYSCGRDDCASPNGLRIVGQVIKDGKVRYNQIKLGRTVED